MGDQFQMILEDLSRKKKKSKICQCLQVTKKVTAKMIRKLKMLKKMGLRIPMIRREIILSLNSHQTTKMMLRQIRKLKMMTQVTLKKRKVDPGQDLERDQDQERGQDLKKDQDQERD